MRFFVPLLIFFTLFTNAALAQDIRYVSGDQSVPLRAGAGDDYQIVHRGIPPGARLIVSRTSNDGLWADITTDSGVTGWIPAQRLLVDPIAPDTTNTAEVSSAAESTDEDAAPNDGAVDPADQLRIRDEQFNAVAQELYRLKRVSGQAEQLDIDNRRLVEITENLRSKVEMLQAENLRLHDKVESEDFMNGALAVLLGVVIALVAPRLVPKRRKSSSWA